MTCCKELTVRALWHIKCTSVKLLSVKHLSFSSCSSSWHFSSQNTVSSPKSCERRGQVTELVIALGVSIKNSSGMLYLFILVKDLNFCRGEVLTASHNYFLFIFRTHSRRTYCSGCQGLYLCVGPEACSRKTAPSSFYEVLKLGDEKFSWELPNSDGLEV